MLMSLVWLSLFERERSSASGVCKGEPVSKRDVLSPSFWSWSVLLFPSSELFVFDELLLLFLLKQLLFREISFLPLVSTADSNVLSFDSFPLDESETISTLWPSEQEPSAPAAAATASSISPNDDFVVV